MPPLLLMYAHKVNEVNQGKYFIKLRDEGGPKEPNLEKIERRGNPMPPLLLMYTQKVYEVNQDKYFIKLRNEGGPKEPNLQMSPTTTTTTTTTRSIA